MSAVSQAFEPCFKLPLSFDPARLRRDLDALEGFEWAPEAPFIMKTPFATKTQTYHDGKWKGLALRSQGGSYTCTDPGGPGLDPITDSHAMSRTPYFREVIDALPCGKRTVRLLSLPGGAEIGTHVDPYHGFKFGQIRLHCPIVTHPDVKMIFESQSYHWAPGELWYADFGRAHAVQNMSSTTRIHMVIDALISPELLSLFPPEFVGEQRRSGILMQEQPVPAEQAQLSRYTCDFSFPGALIQGLLETDDGSVPGELGGSVRIEGSRLVLCIEGTPLFGLVPTGEHRFTLTGWTPERLVVFETDTNGRAERLIFKLRAGKNESVIQIPVHAPAMAH
jgi:aspartate beta-hydroxylase